MLSASAASIAESQDARLSRSRLILFLILGQHQNMHNLILNISLLLIHSLHLVIVLLLNSSFKRCTDLSSKQQGSCLLVSPTPPTSVKSHASTDTDAADAPLLLLVRLRLRLHFFNLPTKRPEEGGVLKGEPTGTALLCNNSQDRWVKYWNPSC